ncbi:PREDICTED: putative disease resistance [Prunus dulcis]|uniref:PREDICTED: putative disease resistance n=1 Tax=Prunus dulcis TaxID=3755 RepID=A0A5E4FVP7_PRUDU|nr:putative disease resistance protein At3g14460 [Prunus dulcis]VVA31537.1 PREDICTED: putative disease resistance [Prunus dulcis]
MALGEIFLAAFLQLLLDRLTPRNFLNFAQKEGVGKEMKKWTTMLSAIGAVLHDAEEKQLRSEAVKLWLDDLKDLAYDVEDMLDKFSTEMFRRRANKLHGAIASKVRSLIPRVKFNSSMNSEIKVITDRLHEISEQKDKLGLNYIGTSSSKARQRSPSSSLLDGPVVGRDGDKAKILELLSRDEPSSANFHVVSIVGMAGVGKTTLAQLVFNDNDVSMKFSPKAWVSVSDDFNIVRVTRAILESITSRHCDLEEFSNIQDNLSKELAGKKFLIVLDDVWNTCDYDLWIKLQSPFRVGALGSKVIVTTRDGEVAKMMRAIEVHNLECISNDDCWRVFEQHAFLNVNNGKPPNIELYREKIAIKCGGLPLAARALGGLLGCKEIDEWEEILNSNLWKLSDKINILPVLNVSYHYLASSLKRCFAYCSILPNDYEFGEKQLILLWMAEGLIQQSEESKQMEDIGGEYFRELISRSLFQKSSKNNSQYVMHDLVSELARWAAGDTCFRLDDSMQRRCSPKVRHMSYISGEFDGVKKFKAFFEVTHLRTFLPLQLSDARRNSLTSKVNHDLLPKLQYLRVLSLNGYTITELLNSIGDLKFLRYLDLSYTLIVSLPESVSTLYNLQTLILENCSLLKVLPTNMSNLINLRHLNISDVPLLEGMPPQFGQLANLQTITNFVVGKGHESKIREIGPLRHLKSTLHLSGLENVIDAEDARRADLISKEGLDVLVLKWKDMREPKSDVLDMLQPSRKLKQLTITGYGGLEFATWLGDPLFSNMVLIRLYNCNNCSFLPPLGKLPCLKELHIIGMPRVESVGLEFYGEGCLPFPLLQTLLFQDMQHWKEWSPCESYQGIGVFPCMTKLTIKRCPVLEGRLPEDLDSLEKLEIDECENLMVSIANYKQLRNIDIHGCKGMVHASAVEFRLLESMHLSDILKLTFRPERFMRGLSMVKDLNITGCEELTSSWKNEDRLLQHLVSLRRLVIKGNSKLVQLHHLTSLQELQIDECSNLVSFTEASLPHSLKVLTIESCPSLMYLARDQIPPSIRRIIIRRCQNLKSLVDVGIEGSLSSFPSLMQEETSCLEYLSIDICPSLTSLSSRGHLPKTLKHLLIDTCKRLESITERFEENTCLEYLCIYLCQNLKFLPEGLCNLSKIQSLLIYGCGNLVSFPIGGLPRSASNLTEISIINCDKLEALPEGINFLNSLQILRIPHFPEGGFPPYLASLSIMNLKICRPLLEWGLHRLTSLRVLCISGEDPDLVSFPPEKEMLLPESLVQLDIIGFPNLKYLGFQFLTSLESLKIWSCPKLTSIPGEGLSLSLTQLSIRECPILEEKCKPGKGQYWPSISHIPYIWIGGRKITTP